MTFDLLLFYFYYRPNYINLQVWYVMRFILSLVEEKLNCLIQ